MYEDKWLHLNIGIFHTKIIDFCDETKYRLHKTQKSNFYSLWINILRLFMKSVLYEKICIDAEKTYSKPMRLFVHLCFTEFLKNLKTSLIQFFTYTPCVFCLFYIIAWYFRTNKSNYIFIKKNFFTFWLSSFIIIFC